MFAKCVYARLARAVPCPQSFVPRPYSFVARASRSCLTFARFALLVRWFRWFANVNDMFAGCGRCGATAGMLGPSIDEIENGDVVFIAFDSTSVL